MKSTAVFSGEPLQAVRRLLFSFTFIAAAPALLLLGCQSGLIYHPKPYPAGHAEQWAETTPGRLIDFETSQGGQRAFLQGDLRNPRHLWIVCAGNASLALDWSHWLADHAPAGDAWLLVDFPGYGDCEGSPTPGRLRETFRTVIPLACHSLGWDRPDPERLRFLGASLGAAACLIAASEFSIRDGVLVCPFTSTMDMTREFFGIHLGFLVTHRYDNRRRLAELSSPGGGRIIIVHGDRDEIIPVRMSRELAGSFPDLVELREAPGGLHNDLPVRHISILASALRDVSAR